jgi:Arrestin (or S-antigen), C-terminal domain
MATCETSSEILNIDYLFRQMVANEITLRTSESNINIYGPYNFSQSLTEQIMIPTSTPPTIDKKGKIIYISYKVRVTVNLNSKHSAKRQNIVTVELPIVVGTWPRAAVPIDEDDEWIDGMDSMMLSDEEAPADNDSLYDYSTSEQNFVPDIQHNTSSSSASLMLHNQAVLRPNPEWRLSTSSTSSSTSSANAAARANLSTNYPNTTDHGVFRSDSNASKVSVKSAASVSSNKSSRSFEANQDRLTRNTSVSTTASAPEQPTASGRYVRTTPVQASPAPPPPFNQPALIKAHGSYIPRSSSATDLNRPPNGVSSSLPFVQQPPYDDGGLYRHRGVPPTNENMHDPRFRGGRSANDAKRYHSVSDASYTGVLMNGNNSHMPYPPSSNMYDHGPMPNGFLPTVNNYSGQAGRHMRTPSDSSHMYHTQPNYPTAAKFTPMPAVPDTQRTMYPFSQDDANRTNHHHPIYPNLPQFTPPRQFDSPNGLSHRHSDPQSQPDAVIHTLPVVRSGSDPSAYLKRDDRSQLETPSSAAPQVEQSVVEPHGYYDSSDSSSECGDAAGSASDDSDDSDDEGDLLRIVEKKRRLEQKQMRRRQRRVFTIAE